MLAVNSRLVIMFVLCWCLLLLFWFNLKPIISWAAFQIACLMAFSSMMVKIKETSVSPCRTPAITSKNSESGGKTLAFVPVLKRPIAATIDSRIPYPLKIFNIFPLCMISTSFLKLVNTSVAFRFLSFTPSVNLLRAKICTAVVLPGLNPFWLGHKYGWRWTFCQI